MWTDHSRLQSSKVTDIIYHTHSCMVAEPGSVPKEPTEALAMARSVRGAGARPSLGEEIMDVVGADLAEADLPLG